VTVFSGLKGNLGLASFQQCVTDSVIYPPMGSMTSERMMHVVWSVCLSVGHTGELFRNG